MNNEELLTVLEHIEREKGIDKELLFKAIESALVSAARKIVGNKEAEVEVSIDRSTGIMEIKSGGKEIKHADFGRIAAQTAKQVIIQKIREAERNIIFEDYEKRVGTITSGSVHRFERGDIVIDLGKTEAILPRSQQCQRERYRQGDRIRAYILEVGRTAHGPQIILSRSSTAFVKKLFETEVPEIGEGIVEIKAIAREGGERTKVAVWSKDDKVDAVGACVGMRGSRVKDIVKELQGERVDIVRWSDDIKEFVKAALSPAEIKEMKIYKESKKIALTLPDDQLSIGIGKHGQNVRLASKLIGWELDIIGKDKKAAPEAQAPSPLDSLERGADGVQAPVEKEGEEKKEEAKGDVSITEIEGVGAKTAKILAAAGYDTVDKIKGLTVEDLTKLEGVGAKTAEKILMSVKGL